MMRCVRIGFGKIARIHEEQLTKFGVVTIGVLETSISRQQEVIAAGFHLYTSLAAAAKDSPDFYDLCIPADVRLEVLVTLCKLAPDANILIEKPICGADDIVEIRRILTSHRGKVSINENYATSNVTKAVLQSIEELKITPIRVIIESTKHRGLDFLTGRYRDNRLGAIGYEGSHLLAIIHQFGPAYDFNEFVKSDINHMQVSARDVKIAKIKLPDLPQRDANVVLRNQGSAYIRYRANNGCMVDLYTSMSGQIGFPLASYATPGQIIPLEDSRTRYRMLRVEGTDSAGSLYQIVGFYEPIVHLARSLGQLIVFKDGVQQGSTATFEDNTMAQHLSRILKYFQQREATSNSNPYSFETALKDVALLNGWMGTINKATEPLSSGRGEGH